METDNRDYMKRDSFANAESSSRRHAMRAGSAQMLKESGTSLQKAGFNYSRDKKKAFMRSFV
ncbi:MAG: hypothetical protein AB1631_16155 [Acidobacteriota bacterium]